MTTAVLRAVLPAARRRLTTATTTATAAVSRRAYSDATRAEPNLAYAILESFERGHKYKAPFKTVSIIGAPFSDGQQFAGSDAGPALLREAGLFSVLKDLKWRVEDRGDLKLKGYKTADPEMSPEDEDVVGGPCNLSYAVGNACKAIYDEVQEVASRDVFPLVIGGDHSIAMGSVPGILAARPNTAVIWVDAHADVNTPATSGSGNMHGMPVAFFTENGIPYDRIPGCEWVADAPKLDPKNLVYIGLRDLDAGEKRWLRQSGAGVFTMSEIDGLGIGRVMQLALQHVLRDGPRPIHLSFDIDSVDPALAPSTGTRVRGGLSYREAHFCVEAISDSGHLQSMDIVEVNPTLNPRGAADTVSMAVGILASAFGARIW